MSDPADPILPIPKRPIAMPSRRDLLIGLPIAAAAGIAWARNPHQRTASIKPGQLDSTVPLTIGDWHYQSASGIVLPPPDELARLLYDQQLSRLYVSERSLPVMLVMAYGSSQGGMLQVHRPEICYPASGFRLTRTQAETFPGEAGVKPFPIRTFSALSDTRIEHVMYWTRVGDALPTGWTAQRIAIMRENLLGRVPDGLLVRLSCVIEDRARAMETMQEFVRTMLTATGPDGRYKLLGARYS